MKPAALLHQWLTPHPDSLCLCVARPGVLKRGFERYTPLVNLIWTTWLLTSPWVFKHFTLLDMLITYSSALVFLVLYLRGWYGSRSRLGWNIFGIAVLSLAVLPINSAAWTYVIYACTLLPFYATPRVSLPCCGVLLLLFAADARYSGFNNIELFSALMSCIGLYAVNAVWRNNARREAELRLSHEEVRRLAALAERERIGRDLHDLLGHTLSLIAIKSELADKLFERDPEASRRELQQLRHVAREALAEVRHAVTGIRAAGLAAECVSAKLLLETAGIRFTSEFADCALPPDAEAALALGLRELATNIERHSRAHRAQATLSTLDRAVELRVVDDGRGGVEPTAHGNGLCGLRERLQAVGGSLHIESARGQGTCVSLRVPAPAARALPSSAKPRPVGWRAALPRELPG